MDSDNTNQNISINYKPDVKKIGLKELQRIIVILKIKICMHAYYETLY